MRGLFAVALVAACGRKPPVADVDDSLPPPLPRDHDTAVVALSAVRPAIDLAAVIPDSSERARWPLGLSTHPVLEPHFAIARELADPGITWLALCDRGIPNRTIPGQNTTLEYLHAWCSVAKRDPEDAVARLAALRATGDAISLAVPYDVANILADAGGADDAEKLIDRNQLEHDVQLLDLLAATYVEVGKPDEARELDRLAAEADRDPRPEPGCHRMARGIVIASREQQRNRINTLRRAVNSMRHPGVCATLLHELDCSLQHACADYFADQGLDPRYGDLAAAYEQWPSGAADSTTWLHVAVFASRALGMKGAEDLAVVALETATRASSCNRTILTDVRTLGHRMRDDAARARELDVRLDVLLALVDDLVKRAPASCPLDH